jgi:hypothetical protein
MQISWGTKLTIVFVLFAASMSYMVYQCVQTPVNLVSNQYYNDEIAYQQVIDGTNNANTLSTHVTLQQQGNAFVVQLPAQLKSQVIKGYILFYCSSSAVNDKKFALQQGQSTQQVIQTGKIMPGRYIVKTDWWANNIHYHNEQPVTIQ